MTLNPEHDFIGLAPFLRLSIAGDDLRPVAQALLERARQAPDTPGLWMNLATAFLTLGERALGLDIQAQALQQQRRFTLPARRQPARCRLLVLLAAGDLAENTPIDCLLEDSQVELIYQYVSAAEPLPADHPLRRAPRTVLTPHLGYVTEDTYATFFSDAVEDVLAYLEGAPVRVLEA